MKLSKFSNNSCGKLVSSIELAVAGCTAPVMFHDSCFSFRVT